MSVVIIGFGTFNDSSCRRSEADMATKEYEDAETIFGNGIPLMRINCIVCVCIRAICEF